MILRQAMAYKLIVADSSPSVQKAVQMAFPDSEFEIYLFDDGLELMNSVSSINPDAVLLSLSLPRKDGYEVGSFLRSQEELRKISLLLLKGAFEPLDKERLAGLEHDGIVQEPFDSERLVQVIRGIIERKTDPGTLPEEALLDEVPRAEKEPEREAIPSLSPEWKTEFEERIRDMLRGEILDVQRELEKRIKVQVLAELKSFIPKESLKDEKKQE